MGLIRTALDTLGGTLGDQWQEFIGCDAMGEDTLVSLGRARNGRGSANVISDGSKIIVSDGQAILIVENGKILDFCAEPGGFIWNTGAEPSFFLGGLAQFGDGIKKMAKTALSRFAFGGQPTNDQRVYYCNTKEIMNNKLGFGEIPFRDAEFGFTVKLRGYGVYSFRMTNPAAFYINVCGNVADSFRREDIAEQLRAELQQAIMPALGGIAQKGIPYDQLPVHVKELTTLVNKEMSAEWGEKRGIMIESFALSSVQPDEASAAKIAQFQESRVYADPAMLGSRVGTAQANAMETAAGNAAGAMAGFYGMNMAQQAGGMNAATLMQMGQTQPSAPAKPAAEGWKCACGSVNQGKFCPECGGKKPAGAPLYRCDKCGWKPADPAHPPRFCPECGDPFTDDDIG